MSDGKNNCRKGNDRKGNDRKGNDRKGNDRKGNDRKGNDRKGNDRESCESGKAEAIDDDSLEKLLTEQMRKQVRSDYRRSLGKECQRRYME